MPKTSRFDRVKEWREKRAQDGHSTDHDDSMVHHRIWNADTERRMDKEVADWNRWIKENREIREECIIGPGFQVPTAEEFKKFARFATAGARGQIVDAPSTSTITMTLSHVFSAILRATGIFIDDGVKKDVHAFIKHQLTAEKIVSKKRKPKKDFGFRDMKYVQQTLWTQPDPSWLRTAPRDLVMRTLFLHLLVSSGARIGAFCPKKDSEGTWLKKGLQYQDFTLTLIPNDSQKPEWVVAFSQRFIKGNLDPEDNGITLALAARGALERDSVLWFLALALADGALDGFDTATQLWNQKIPADQFVFEVKWRADYQELPIFRRERKSREPMHQGEFRSWWNPMMLRTGYTVRPTVHRIRQKVANIVDKYATPSQRRQALGQTQSVFDQSYISSISSLDIQGLFFGETPRFDHIEKLQGASIRLVRGFPTTLPASIRTAALNDPIFIKLTARRNQLTPDKRPEDSHKLENEIRNLRYRLEKIALKEYQERWLEDKYNRDVATGGMVDIVPTSAQKAFCREIEFRPVHKRVAAVVAGGVEYTEQVRRGVLEDLIELASQDVMELQRPNEVPIDGRCPVTRCGKLLSSDVGKVQAHIHECRELEFLQECCPWGEGARYCFECFEWQQDGPVWVAHCRMHLDTPPMRCSIVALRSIVITPGYCPFCLGDIGGSPQERFKQYENSATLRGHIDQHLNLMSKWPTVCPHPLCTEQLDRSGDLKDHFKTAHGFNYYRESPLGKRNRVGIAQVVKHSSHAKRQCLGRKDRSPSEPTLNSPQSTSTMPALEDISPLSIGSASFQPKREISVAASVWSISSGDDTLPSLEELLQVNLRDCGSSVCKITSEAFGLEHNGSDEIPMATWRMPPPLPFEDTVSWTDFSHTPVVDVTSPYILDSPELLESPSQSCPQCQGPIPVTASSGFLQREIVESCPVCTQSKTEALQQQWRKLGYPDIDWDGLPQRVEQYIPMLRELLEAQDVPVFRQQYEKGTATTESQEYLINHPRYGYYGPRGEDIITTHLMPLLYHELKAAEVKDHVVAQTPIGYWTHVIVPAVIVWLIKDDMRQGEDAALDTWRKSATMGLLMNEE